MALVTLSGLSIGFRGPPLLDRVDFRIEPGMRIGLLGRNGSGKTTLLRMLSGQVEPDAGEILFSPGARLALLEQDVPRDLLGSIHDVVLAGSQQSGPDLSATHDEHDAAWQAEHRVEQTLSRMELDPAARFETLSSGMKRRVLLARALAASPDLLLLDEPTNHLDIDAIVWLETFLARWNGTLMFVTHDRTFLRKLANRILEVDRGRLFDWSCDYDTFLQRKEAALAAEEKQNALFDKRLAEEEVWIRKGIQARRTRNEGRVRQLEAMRRTRASRRETTDRVSMDIQAGQRSGMLVAEVENISVAYPNRPLISNFSTSIMRGDKLGIIGGNGVGKTTLIRVLLGQLPPQAGSVRLGSNLQIAYFDQLRQQLDEEQTVQQNVGDGSDAIRTGEGTRHIIGYLQDFLFSAERARTPVKFLSGGERNRVLLAKLLAKPANVIVLDEPTNDLDAETLELLETRLVEFTGTVLLVSHDRSFLNNVVSSVIAFEADGLREYVGGYDDWQRQKMQAASDSKAAKAAGTATSGAAKTDAANAASTMTSPVKKRKLTYKEQQELTNLPAQIEQLETAIAAMHAAMASEGFYRLPGDEIAREQGRLKLLDQELQTAYGRWELLEPLAD